MDENSKRHLLSTFDDIIELMATQGKKVVCRRLLEIRKLLREQPEIVLCKDCKHRNEYRTGSCPFYTTWGSAAPDDWFCADGKRR